MKAQAFARLAGLVAALAGVAVLAGWTFDVAVLKSLLPGATTMKANTALAFVALGLALRRLADEREAQRGQARALAGAAAVLAGLTFLEYLAGTNSGIDELLFADPATLFPGRMAPATAAAFLLQAAALLLAAGRIPAAQGCTLGAGGEIRVLAARGHARHDIGTAAREAAGACWDITERRRSEDMIRNLNQSLEQRVAERTVQLEAAVKELEAFSYSVAHDLRAPLRGLDGFSQILMEDYGTRLDADAQDHLQRIRGASQRMGNLIDNLLELSRLMRTDMTPIPIDLGRMAGEVVAELRREEPAREVEVAIAPNLCAKADPTLARVILDNLLRNAWKYTAKTADARIAFESQPAQDGGTEFIVRDNGAGFDMRFVDKLFQPFQRLHHARDFAGIGVGLASVARAVQRHGGRIRAEGEVGRGATFRFTLEAGEAKPGALGQDGG